MQQHLKKGEALHTHLKKATSHAGTKKGEALQLAAFTGFECVMYCVCAVFACVRFLRIIRIHVLCHVLCVCIVSCIAAFTGFECVMYCVCVCGGGKIEMTQFVFN